MTKKQALKLVKASRKTYSHASYKIARNLFFSEEMSLTDDMFTRGPCTREMLNMLESLAYSYNGDIA